MDFGWGVFRAVADTVMDRGRRSWYLVNYDICDARRWRQVYKIMNGYGERLQYSLFRCFLTVAGMEKMRNAIEREVADEDAFLIVCLGRDGRIIERRGKETWVREERRDEGYRIL